MPGGRSGSRTTLGHIKHFLSGAFRYARRQGVLENPNPMHDVEIPKARPAGETYAYSIEEEAQMLAILPEPTVTVVATAVSNSRRWIELGESGGEGGIRTPGTGFGPYNGLANRRLQPLGHLSAANYLANCSADQAPATARNCVGHFFGLARWNAGKGCPADHFDSANDQNTGSCV